MPTIDFQKRAEAFIELGKKLQEPSDELTQVIQQAQTGNHWFDPQSTAFAISSWAEALSRENMDKWLEPYKNGLSQDIHSKKVGLILAGNIPLVGFHDILCVLISGHYALIKTSSSDDILIRFVMNKLVEIEPHFAAQFGFTERLKEFHAVIATGSDNSARYFDHYFGKYPHIIRKNRTSVAILNGKETSAELSELGKDIFTYYGLGCRNVSKLFVPEGYQFDHFYESIESFSSIIDNFKYSNNYDYNRTLLLMNNINHLDNRFLMISENGSLHSPMASLYYETYKNTKDLQQKLSTLNEEIQCVVSKDGWYEKSIPFGHAQIPGLWDYADNVDTMAFLIDNY